MAPITSKFKLDYIVSGSADNKRKWSADQAGEFARKACKNTRKLSKEVEVIVPPGCGMYATVKVLALQHAHGINGRSISHVIEVE